MMDERDAILVIDDDEGTRKTLALILKKKGFDVITAGTGEDGLKQAQSRKVAVALLDINLPDIEGIRLITPLKEMHPDLAVIMITGFASMENAMRALNEGATGYILKPVNIDEILVKIQDALERQHLIKSKQQAEEALRISEEKYRSLVENINDVIYSLDEQGVITYISPAIEKISGYPPSQLTGHPFADFIVKEDLPGVMQAFEAGMKGTITSFPFRIITKSGDQRWLSVSSYPTFTNGNLSGVHGVLSDITEQKKAEEEERLTRERFETLVKVSGMRDASETELSEYVMEAACRMTGSTLAFIGNMTPDESVMDIVAWSVSVMQDCRVAVSPIHFPIEKAGIWADAIRTRKPVIVNDYSAPYAGKNGLPEGHVRITRFLSLPILDNGKIVMVAAVANKPSDYDEADITRLTLLMQEVWGILQKWRSDEALQESEEKFRGVAERSSDIIMLTNEQGLTTYFAPSVTRILGYDPGEIEGRAPEDFIHPEDLELVNKNFRKNMDIPAGTEGFEVRVRKKDGSYAILEFSGTSIIREGIFSGLQIIGRDITARKHAEEAVQAAVRLSQMIDTMSVSESMIYTLDEAERLTESRIGFFHFINPDQKTIRLIAWSTKTLKHCFIPKEPDRHYPVSKAGIWVNCLRERRPVIHNDYASLPHKKGLPEGHVPVLRELVVPIFNEDKIVAIIGVGNKDLDYRENDTNVLTLLAKNAWTLIQRKQAEDALRESEERFRTMIEQSPLSIQVMSPDGRTLQVNPAFEKLWGLTLEDLKDYNMLIDEQLISLGIMPYIRRGFIGEAVSYPAVQYDCSMTPEFGNKRWVQGSIYPVRDTGGTIRNVILVHEDITEQKKAEEALRESEEKFRNIFNNANDAIEIVDQPDNGLPGRYLDLNDVACGMLLYTREEMLQLGPLDINTDNFSRPFDEIMRELHTTGHAIFETEHRRKDGMIVPVEVNTHKITLMGKTVLISIARDITERKHAEETLQAAYEQVAASEKLLQQQYFALAEKDEAIQLLNRDLEKRVEERTIELRQANEALHENEEKFRLVFEKANDAIFLVAFSPDGLPEKIIEVNETACSMMKYTRDEFLRLSIREIDTPETWEEILGNHKKMMETGHATFEGVHIAKDGEKIPVEISAHTINLRGQDLILAHARDITERKRMEDALKQSERQLIDILNHLPDATMAINLEGKVIVWNMAIEEMTGIEKENILGKGNYEHSLPFYGKRRPLLLDLILKEDKDIEKEYPSIIRKDHRLISEIFIPILYGGKGAYLGFIASPLFNAEGNVIGAIESIRDITENKQLEEMNKKSITEKEVLLKEIHHRVKNNMQVISSLLFMQERLVKDDKTREILRDSQNRIKSMALVHEKLYQSVDLVRIDYAEYLQKISRHLFESYHIDSTIIRLQISSETVFLDIDKAVPCSLILNELISNSLKHAFPQGRKGIITIDLQIKAGTYILKYSDDGIGIPDGITVDETKSLGMHLINGLVKQLNGSIMLNSKTGMKYTITFP